MFSTEVRQLFLEFIDETDTTFQSNASTDSFLDLGYEQFRNFALQHDPNLFIKRAVIDMDVAQDNNTRIVDLSSFAVVPNTPAGVPFVAPLMGPLAVPGERLVKLRSAAAVDNNGAIRFRLDQVNRQEDFYNYTNSDNPQVCLEGFNLITSINIGGNLQLEYMEQPQGGWSAGFYLDDLNAFHPLIAIYAARYYMIKDGGIAEQLQVQGAKLEKAFEYYLQQGRTQGSWFVQYQEFRMTATRTTLNPILKDDYGVSITSEQLENSPKGLAALKLLAKKKGKKRNGK